MKKIKGSAGKRGKATVITLLAAATAISGVAFYYGKKGPCSHKKEGDASQKKDTTGAKKSPSNGVVVASVGGNEIYKKDVDEMILLLERRSKKSYTEEEKKGLYSQILELQIKTLRRQEAVKEVARHYGVEKSAEFQENLSKAEGYLKDKMDKEREKIKTQLVLIALGKIVSEEVLKGEAALSAEADKISRAEKELTFLSLQTADRKTADRVKKALDADSIDKRQSTFEKVSLSIGKEKPLTNLSTSSELSRMEEGKRILSMAPGTSQIFEKENNVAVILCVKKESLSKKKAYNQAYNQAVEEKMKSKVEEAEKKIGVERRG